MVFMRSLAPPVIIASTAATDYSPINFHLHGTLLLLRVELTVRIGERLGIQGLVLWRLCLV